MKTVFSYRTTISFDIQPFEELSNFQSLNSSILSSGNYCCCISLLLKMIKGYRCRLLTKTYSMIVVYSYRPGSFLKVLRFSAMPSIRPLAPISYMRPVLSIFHRSAYIIFLIAGKSKSGNYVCIASIVAPLIRTASIQRVWRVLTDGLRRKKPSSQCFPTPVAECNDHCLCSESLGVRRQMRWVGAALVQCRVYQGKQWTGFNAFGLQ